MKLTLALLLPFIATICFGQGKIAGSNTGAASIAIPYLLEKNGNEAPYGPLDIVQCVLQDRANNLWFCTTGGEGVFRYDGNSFKNFTTRDGLCNNDVYSILEDKNGELWFGTARGACRYNGKTFSSMPIPAMGNDVAKDLRYAEMVNCMLQDKAGNIWLAIGGRGIFRYDGKTFVNYLHDGIVMYGNRSKMCAIKSMLQDRKGNIWFGSWSGDGIYRYDGRSFIHYTSADGLGDDMISCMYEDKDGAIWLGTRDNGISKYTGKSFATIAERDGLCNNNISCILKDRMDGLWFGSAVKYGYRPGGICSYNGKAFTKYTPKGGLENSDIFCSAEDRDGNLWFGGRYGRLFRYDGKVFTDFSAHIHK